MAMKWTKEEDELYKLSDELVASRDKILTKFMNYKDDWEIDYTNKECSKWDKDKIMTHTRRMKLDELCIANGHPLTAHANKQ